MREFILTIDAENVSDLFFNADNQHYICLFEDTEGRPEDNQIIAAIRQDAKAFLNNLCGGADEFASMTRIDDPVAVLVDDFMGRI